MCVKSNNKILVIIILLLWFAFSQSTSRDIPSGYYNGTEGFTGEVLRSILHNIIDNHNSQSYGNLHELFEDTDAKSNNTVWDMYSDNPSGNPPYIYHFVNSDQCGNYSGEGDCYNREHSWPSSWFDNGSPMKSDLFHVYPTDGYVNGMRSNYPFGEVQYPNWTSQNGSKRGVMSSYGYYGTVFEPIDEYKGDFARTYFYMSTRYYTEDNGWIDNDMVNGADLKEWAVDMLIDWHDEDPVSVKEINRNEEIYDIQNNRNPFVDHPEFVDRIWGSQVAGISDKLFQNSLLLHSNYPNPFNPKTVISYQLHAPNSVLLAIYNVNGQLVDQLVDSREGLGYYEVIWDANEYQSGIYFAKLTTGNFTQTHKMVLIK